MTGSSRYIHIPRSRPRTAGAGSGGMPSAVCSAAVVCVIRGLSALCASAAVVMVREVSASTVALAPWNFFVGDDGINESLQREMGAGPLGLRLHPLGYQRRPFFITELCG